MSLPLNAFQQVRPKGHSAPSAAPARTNQGSERPGNVPITLPGSSTHRKPQTMRRNKGAKA